MMHRAIVAAISGFFLSLIVGHASATAYFAAGTTAQGFSPEGNAGAAGTSAGAPWTPAKCFTDLAAGDSCTYAVGNYQSTDFVPTDSGSAGNLITHQCATNHGCSFSNITFDTVSYLLIDGLKSDTYFYDSTHDFTQPRLYINASDHIKITDLSMRGEPQICADGNPGTPPFEYSGGFANCSAGYGRYVDLGTIQNSHEIEITVDDGQTLFFNGDHTIFTLHSDGDGTAFESNESNIFIHGTATNPIKASSERHHGVANYGAARVLFEDIIWQQTGNGDGSIFQPDNSTELNVGGTFHGATPRHQVVRYNVFSLGGSATSSNYLQQPIEIGTYGQVFTTVVGACFAHNSHYREWGAVGSFGGGPGVTAISQVAVLNAAIDQAWYMHTFNSSLSTGRAEEYIFHAYDYGQNTTKQVYLDGIYARNAHGTDKMLFDEISTVVHRTFASDPYTADGIQFGSTNVNYTGDYFTNAGAEDFTPAVGSSLIDAAVPIALTTDSGTADTTITVDRPECFMGTMGGMRAGDVIDVNGDETTVVDVAVSGGALTGVLTVNPGITFAMGESVRFKRNGVIFNEVGAKESAGAPVPPTAPTLGVVVTP